MELYVQLARHRTERPIAKAQRPVFAFLLDPLGGREKM